MARNFKYLLLFSFLSVAVAIGLTFSIGLPTSNIVTEPITLSMLSRKVPESEMVLWLRATGSDWTYGTTWTSGAALTSFDLRHNKNDVKPVIQAAFEKRIWFCFLSGDIVTAAFNSSGKLVSWRKEQGVDGC